MNFLDSILHLTEIFGVHADEPGVLVVEIIFSLVWQLLDASLDDEGLLQLTPEKKSRWPIKPEDMEIDGCIADMERNEQRERLKNLNTLLAIELIGQFLQNKVTAKILYLARQNMSEFSLYKLFLNSTHRFKCYLMFVYVEKTSCLVLALHVKLQVLWVSIISCGRGCTYMENDKINSTLM